MIFWEFVVHQISFQGKKEFYWYLLKYDHTVQFCKKRSICELPCTCSPCQKQKTNNISLSIFRCVLASLYEGLSVRPSVGPSVRPLVGWLVTLSSKTRLINIFEQMIATGGLLGSLDASLHLYKTVYPSIGLSVHWSVCHASVNVFQQVKERESQEESHVVTSSHNHFIIMRTHRWPYGPCLWSNTSHKIRRTGTSCLYPHNF